MELFDTEVMAKAFMTKDSSFDGLFYIGVKTTGIFCSPSCSAKKAKRENLHFFRSTAEALVAGYRPCKICKPIQKPGSTPKAIKQLIEKVTRNPSIKLGETELKQAGSDPDTVRRWFKRHHGITFHEWHRALRINTAFKKMENGASVTDSAYDAGYDSLSGFNDSFRSIFGRSPSESRGRRVIDLHRFDTPLGPMIACASGMKLCMLEFSDQAIQESELKDWANEMDATVMAGKNDLFGQLETELEEYFKGSRKAFTIPLHTPGTPFQMAVWRQLQSIPYGATCSYKEQAEAIGKPKAVRAVANANGMNRITIIIPCHRVIGSDGTLTGYGAGIWRKKYLLDLEKKYRGNG
ncbi:MAG: methylated-DNA--[protein]-cysteine S-methyltransferase [Balneolaceae bacterium]